MADISQQLVALQGDLKNYFSKNAGRFERLQTQVDAIDLTLNGRSIGGGPIGGSNIRRAFEENESLKRLLHDKKGRAIITLDSGSALEGKATITSGASGTVGSSTSGVLMIDRTPGIVQEARQQLTMRNVLSARPTSLQLVDFVKVNTPMAIASPQVEAAAKAENAVTFSTQSERVKTIATWVPATRQVLDDFEELLGFISQTLVFELNIAEELQLLSGDGTGENLHGLIPQATAFSAGLLSSTRGWNQIDIIGRAIQQITTAKELQPSFVVLHPTDWWGMRLTKDSYGRYLLGDPQSGGVQASNGFALQVFQKLFELTPVVTTSINAGSFLVGSSNPMAAEIRDRMESQVEISTENSDYFVRNMVAIRAEKRLCLVTKRPASFVTGTFSTSPL